MSAQLLQGVQSNLSRLGSAIDALIDRIYGYPVSGSRSLDSNGISYTPLGVRRGQWSTVLSKPTRLKYILAASLTFVGLSFIAVLWVTNNGRASHQYPIAHSELSASSVSHPILQLATNARSRFDSVEAAQSATLSAAVQEYRRRYHMPPPPHFDKWYEFAVEHKVLLIDEYDSIFDSLLLFWSITPAEIRSRAREAIAHDNSLLSILVRNGQSKNYGEGQGGYQGPTTNEMIGVFAQWLPDMDLAFNVNDEPRVVIPYGDVIRMKAHALSNIQTVSSGRNGFTHAPDLNDGSEYPGVATTRFNRMDRQRTWIHSCMSCPPDSPARNVLTALQDEPVTFSYGGIGFVDNITAFGDVCLTPSLRSVIGVFSHPNVFSVSHELVPVFSPSKLSSFHDIIYPSSYYYAEKTSYHNESAVRWNEKAPKLYWRGATSGGYSEDGRWEKLLRQSIVSKLMSPGPATHLVRQDDRPDTVWVPKEIPSSDLEGLYDTVFTEIKQCSPEDCSAMRGRFGVHAHATQEEAWHSRYLLDMDGNALSGRFYALLRSFSLPMKVAYYLEWHTSRIIPWKHYVPLSASTVEYAETLRYFEHEDDGRKIAEGIAVDGRVWAEKTLRKEDMQAYMFRLLLEYGRVVDDDRLNLGFHE